MGNRLRSRWLDLSQSLGFVPGLIVVLFAIVGIVLVEVDGAVDVGTGSSFVFGGDASAARTVLSVIAGSLITVAGLTFSITMVVLQLTSSQFSPRILRMFFGDRLTQVTIGTFVGTFVYSILTLRAVASGGNGAFVPRLSVTLDSLLGILAVLLLIAYLHHVSQLVQVSHVVGDIAHRTLARLEHLYPERYGAPAEDVDAEQLLAEWRAEPAGAVVAERPGYVLRVALDELADRVEGRADRVVVRVCAGDFAGIESPVAEVWPREAVEECRKAVHRALTVDSERDLDQDVAFGIRQLTDTALRAISPAVNDPTTAVTCIGYVRSILVRLAERSFPGSVRRFGNVTVVARERRFPEYLDSLLQLNRYTAGDAWVAEELLCTVGACAEAAERCGAHERAAHTRAVAATIGEQFRQDAGNERDRARIGELVAEIGPQAATRAR